MTSSLKAGIVCAGVLALGGSAYAAARIFTVYATLGGGCTTPASFTFRSDDGVDGEFCSYLDAGVYDLSFWGTIVNTTGDVKGSRSAWVLGDVTTPSSKTGSVYTLSNLDLVIVIGNDLVEEVGDDNFTITSKTLDGVQESVAAYALAAAQRASVDAGNGAFPAIALTAGPEGGTHLTDIFVYTPPGSDTEGAGTVTYDETTGELTMSYGCPVNAAGYTSCSNGGDMIQNLTATATATCSSAPNPSCLVNMWSVYEDGVSVDRLPPSFEQRGQSVDDVATRFVHMSLVFGVKPSHGVTTPDW